MTYKPTYHADGRKVYNPSRTELDIHDEWAALEARVLEEEPHRPFAELKAKELWRQEEAKAERWSEWQQRVWFPRNAAIVKAAFDANESERGFNLTKEELQRVADHFANANDEVARSIGAKALALLARD